MLQRRRTILQKLTRKQRCRIFALKFKCMRRRFHLMRKVKIHSLKRCRRILKVLRFKLNKKKYTKLYRSKLNKNKLIRFKRFRCKSALLYLRKLRIQKANIKRKFFLKRKRMLKFKHNKIVRRHKRRHSRLPINNKGIAILINNNNGKKKVVDADVEIKYQYQYQHYNNHNLDNNQYNQYNQYNQQDNKQNNQQKKIPH